MDYAEHIQDEIGEIRTEVKELRTTLIGIDGKNGIRGTLEAFKKEFEEWKQKIRDYRYTERENTCYGKKLVEQLKIDLKKDKDAEARVMVMEQDFKVKMLKMANENKKANRKNTVVLICAMLTFLASIWDKIPW